MDSGGSSRMTLPYVPQVRTITPSAWAALATAPVSCGVGFAGGRVDDLDRDHGAAAAHLADPGIGLPWPRSAASNAIALDLLRPLDQTAVLERVEGREGGGAGDGVAAVGAAETAGVRWRP